MNSYQLVLTLQPNSFMTSNLQTLFKLNEKNPALYRNDFALQSQLSVLLPVQCSPRSVEVTAAYCSIRQKCIDWTVLVGVIAAARDNRPVKCLHRRLSTNSAKKFHSQHNLEQPRRCSNIYQATAWWWQISGRGNLIKSIFTLTFEEHFPSCDCGLKLQSTFHL